MNNLMTKCKAFLEDEEGLTVVEYVIGAGMLVGALWYVFDNMGNQLAGKLNSIITNINSQ